MLLLQMKKRAQIPSAHTYTVIFKGCARSKRPKFAVATATKIYMSLVNSPRLKANTIHMNAAIQACAQALDLESMFNIVATANDSYRSPDVRTYTTILQAFRKTLENVRDEMGEDVANQNASLAITRARALWEEVISRWRKGLLVLDEPLVCSMGYVLSKGTRSLQEEILSLIEQTMNIPRPDRDMSIKAKLAEAETKPGAAPGAVIRAPMDPVTPEKGVYVTPGPFALSLVLGALASARRTGWATYYWKQFVKRGVRADVKNCEALFGAFKLGHCSGDAAAMVEMLSGSLLNEKCFVLAIEACSGDILNPHVFDNASRILAAMETKLRKPSLPVLRTYLTIAMRSRAKFDEQAAGGDVDGAKLAFGKQLIQATDRAWQPIRLLANTLMYANKETTAASPLGEKVELYEIARRVMSALDKIHTEKMAPPEEIKFVKGRRNQVNAQITRFHQSDDYKAAVKRGLVKAASPYSGADYKKAGFQQRPARSPPPRQGQDWASFEKEAEDGKANWFTASRKSMFGRKAHTSWKAPQQGGVNRGASWSGHLSDKRP
jgi:hypothetical protein